jgi:hypothetical protein
MLDTQQTPRSRPNAQIAAWWVVVRSVVADLLVHYWQYATADERAAFGEAIGPGALWDHAVAPNL